MPNYIALLRGINVSGQKKIKMAELRKHLEQWGFGEVRTYIQSGNIIFRYDGSSISQIQQMIKTGILRIYGFDVGIWISERSEFIRIFDEKAYDPEDEASEKQLYFVFLNASPDSESVRQLNSTQFENEEFKITPECVYLKCSDGYGNAKCNNNFFEKKLKVDATTRNYRTVKTLIELSE